MLYKNASLRLGFDGVHLFADVGGELDHNSVGELREKTDEQLYRMRPRMLILNLSQVSFMDSSGLGFVVGRARLLKELGGVVKVIGADRQTMKILTLAGLERLPNLKIEGA